METNIPNFLKQRAFLTPDRHAIIFDGKSWTFREMFEEAVILSQKISSLGIKEEDTVALLLKNRPSTVLIIHALQQLRVKTLFLNHRLTPTEMVFQLKDSQAKLVICDIEFENIFHDTHQHISSINIKTIAEMEKLPIQEIKLVQEYSLSDVCSIMYTSGTTGHPKGVLQTYGNHWWSAVGSALNLGLKEDDAWLCTVPLFHISGLSILMRSVIYGIPVYLMEQFNEDKVNALLIAGDVTIMSVVGTTLTRLIHSLNKQEYHSKFRCMLLGGGPAPRPLLEACAEKGIPVFQSYGMTETSSQIVTLSPEDSFRKLGSAGKPLFPAQLKIMSEGRENMPFEAGEIVVKGPNVTIGYLNRPEANQTSFKDGWLYTGDIGYVDDEGYLYVLDRRSDLIISGGENIYPAEIEEVLLAHPYVAEVGVTGSEDAVWGQVPIGFVVINGPVSEEELMEFCKGRLAKYKIPKKIYEVTSLPRNASNKLLRRKLAELIPKDMDR
ncbi:o-succinylbenzoate--CoA ligase [Bacillus sp. FJAT-49736]|uniref:o-succinylbenzoate--CoA ligase n=1 Tax=Bacillus sp. FJAT-49736 TaxID=2833582 RepID=UPI001BCA190D|nr:o-succinylbenzoate--CoA ligase [Bacillus sp. FJAT-49736]MBS4173901.1 o-succinylbenzoate--CoA ligase [Bacillus sp. FJAT-49736]